VARLRGCGIISHDQCPTHIGRKYVHYQPSPDTFFKTWIREKLKFHLKSKQRTLYDFERKGQEVFFFNFYKSYVCFGCMVKEDRFVII